MSHGTESPEPIRDPEQPMRSDTASAEPFEDVAPRRTGGLLQVPVPPVPPDDPDHGSPHRRLSTMVGINFLLLVGSLLGTGYIYMKQAKDEKAVGVHDHPAVTPEEVKAVATDVDQVKATLADLTRKVDAMPAQSAPAPEVKSIRDKLDDLSKTVADFPARLDSLNQKLDTVSKGEGLTIAPRVDAIDKRIGELAVEVEAAKAAANRPASARPAAGPNPAQASNPNPAPAEDVNVEGRAMEQAADLFKQAKYAEAKAAFTKLQATHPDDARVWYYSALANGLATGNWKGETERLVNQGVAREKAGSPEPARIDAVFNGLTAANGKAWLDFYRAQARAR